MAISSYLLLWLTAGEQHFTLSKPYSQVHHLLSHWQQTVSCIHICSLDTYCPITTEREWHWTCFRVTNAACPITNSMWVALNIFLSDHCLITSCFMTTSMQVALHIFWITILSHTLWPTDSERHCTFFWITDSSCTLWPTGSELHFSEVQSHLISLCGSQRVRQCTCFWITVSSHLPWLIACKWHSTFFRNAFSSHPTLWPTES